MENLSLVIKNPQQGDFLKDIAWNKQEFMDFVSSITEQYEGLTYTEEQMKTAKQDRAKLNAMKKAISDRRIEVKNAIMAPYNQFEKEVKEVTALIEKPIAMIDEQIKAFEEQQKKEKKQKLVDFFEKTSEYDFLKFEDVFDSRYLNATFSLSKAKDDIQCKLDKIKADIDTIDNFTSEKYRHSALDIYTKTLDVNAALAEDKRLNDLDKKIEEERKLQEKETQSVEEETQDGEVLAPEKGEVDQQEFRKTEQVDTDETSQTNEYMPQEEKNNVEEDLTQYKTSFTIYGTKTEIIAVKQFMVDNNIKFGKVEN